MNRMFADKDLSSYDEVIFWRAGDAASFKVGYGYAHTQGGSNTGYTRAYVNSFLMEDGSPIYSSSDYQGDELLANVKQGRDNRLVQFMKIKGEAMSKLNNGELVCSLNRKSLLRLNTNQQRAMISKKD